ncbi:MAG: MarR family winged helix-turn-helix transcriptional regulator [Salibacteraceae bacterium]
MNSPKLDEVIYFLMDKAMRSSKKYTSAIFKEHGIEITIDQWVVMRRIYEEKSQTQVELARATSKDTASITRILDLLHNKGLVRRTPNESDRRKSELILTKKGVEMVERTYPIIAQIRAAGINDISSEDMQIAKQVLNKIAQNMKIS